MGIVNSLMAHLFELVPPTFLHCRFQSFFLLVSRTAAVSQSHLTTLLREVKSFMTISYECGDFPPCLHSILSVIAH